MLPKLDDRQAQRIGYAMSAAKPGPRQARMLLTPEMVKINNLAFDLVIADKMILELSRQVAKLKEELEWYKLRSKVK